MTLARTIAVIRLRLRSLTSRHGLDDRVREEIAYHLEMETARGIERGLSPEEAHRDARRRFGGVDQAAEACRDARGLAWLEAFVQDLRHALRALARAPGFVLTSVATLALGIGATSALFSVVDAVLLKPVPLPESDRLVWIDEARHGEPHGGNPVRLGDWLEASSFEGALGFYGEQMVFAGRSGDGTPQRLDAVRTVGRVTGTLGLQPLIGRAFTEDEERGRRGEVAMLSELAWRTRFDADPAVVGGAIRLNGHSYEIVGVLPASARLTSEPDVWIPAPEAVQEGSRGASYLAQIARLKAGSDRLSAQSELALLASGLSRAYPQSDAGLRVALVPLKDRVVEEARAPLMLLFATVVSVLLIVCVNIAGLMVARGLGRQREAAIRAALGAGRARLVRLFLLESGIVAVTGGVLGAAAAFSGLGLLQHWLPADLPRLSDAAVDSRVVAFALGLTLCSAVAAGVLPALQATRRLGPVALKEGSRGSLGTHASFRAALVVAEVAVSMVLLVTAALMATSLARLQSRPLGFEPEGVASFSVQFPWDSSAERLSEYSTRMLERLGAVPGVVAVGVIDRLPLDGGSQSAPVAFPDRALPASLADQPVSWRAASRGAFLAARIRVLAGSLDEFDNGVPGVAVVNEAFIDRYLNGRDPVGVEIVKRLDASSSAIEPGAAIHRIVGVVDSVRHHATDASAPPEVFLPWGEVQWPLMSFVVRGHGEATALLPAVRAAAQSVDRHQVLDGLMPLRDHVRETTSRPASRTWLVVAFALTALALALIGLYGLMSSEVMRRTQEFGVRLALGATPAGILREAMTRGLRLTTAGLMVGGLLAMSTGRLLDSLLVDVASGDVVTTAVTAALLLGSAAAACLVPARRAAAVDPIVALRHE
jgi:putative ABC transport system permease protein